MLTKRNRTAAQRGAERTRVYSTRTYKNSKILKDRSDESQTKVRRKSVKSDQQQSLGIEQSSLDSHSSNKFHSTLRWEVFPMFKCSPISPISAGASTHDRLSLFYHLGS